MFGYLLLQNLERLSRIVGVLKQLQILRGDGVVLDQSVEIQYFFPKLRAIQHDHDFAFELVGLRQSQNFEKLVESAESAGEDNQRARKISEPELAHEEVMELEGERGRDV